MRSNTTRSSLVLRRLQGAILSGIGLLLPLNLHADTERQLVSFEKTYTELGSSESQVTVSLKRFASVETLKNSLSLVLMTNYPAGPGGWSVSSAYFAAGSSAGACTLRMPAGGAAAVDLAVLLEIADSAEVQGFARTGHFIRNTTGTISNSGPTINAVVFSGAETPDAAVEGVPNRTLVVGGIVALGGAQLPPAHFPARLEPKAEYASGVWTPPLSPKVLVIQFSPWTTNKTP